MAYAIESQAFQDPFSNPAQASFNKAETTTLLHESSQLAASSSPILGQPVNQNIAPLQTPANIKKEIKEQKLTNQTIYSEETFTIIGQFSSTYILIEKNKELLFIDQHAAHERILYEQLKKNFQNVATVQLLFPQIVHLNGHETELICKHTELFKNHGIIFEQFSEHEIIIQATPVSMQHKSVQDIIQMTLTWIKQHNFVDEKEFFKQLNEHIHAEKACKTACKAGDVLNHEQMNNIVKTLLTVENRFCCPHGRPTMWNITLKEIEKYFKRDYRSTPKNIDL